MAEENKLKKIISAITSPEAKIFNFVYLILLILLVINILYFPLILKIVSLIAYLLIYLFTFLGIYGIKNQHPSKENENYSENILKVIDDGVIIYDKDFQITYFNETSSKIFRIQPEEVLNKKIQVKDAQDEKLQRLVQVIFPSLAPLIIIRSSPEDEPHIADISFEDPELFLRVLTAKLKNENGDVLGFVKIIHDKTKEVQLLKSKNEFITIASHQLRTPINEIRWAIESIAADEKIDNQTKEILNGTLNSIKRLANLIDNLLNISKIEEGKFGYNFEELNYLDFMKEVLSEMLPQIKHLGLNLYLNPPEEELPMIYFDKQKMYMVISNLLDNAVKYNVQNGKIIVSIQKSNDGKFIETSIEDTGVGIEPETLKNLFSKFFRTSSGEKFNTEGSGLGLYIAKNIIRSHGGKIWAESEVGRGTKITFTLPIDKSLIPKKEVPILDNE
jgi:two-component system sensor histidine kinase VicK